MSTMKPNNFWLRTFTGAVFIAAIIGSVLLSQLIFALLFFGVTLFALNEFYQLLNAGKKIRVSIVSGSIAASILYLSFALAAIEVVPPKFLFINLLLPILIFIFELYRKSANPFLNISLTLFGAIYIGLPFSLLNLLYNSGPVAVESGPAIVLSFFLIIWTYDTFAYLTGILVGKHRLFPRVSPKKTWEGTAGGFIFGLAATFLLSKYFPDFDLLNWLIIASIIMVFGTFGDLSESLLKRSLNIKDSGNILPGHGGLLDRFDAVLMAAPAVFVYIVFT